MTSCGMIFLGVLVFAVVCSTRAEAGEAESETSELTDKRSSGPGSPLARFRSRQEQYFQHADPGRFGKSAPNLNKKSLNALDETALMNMYRFGKRTSSQLNKKNALTNGDEATLMNMYRYGKREDSLMKKTVDEAALMNMYRYGKRGNMKKSPLTTGDEAALMNMYRYGK